MILKICNLTNISKLGEVTNPIARSLIWQVGLRLQTTWNVLCHKQSAYQKPWANRPVQDGFSASYDGHRVIRSFFGGSRCTNAIFPTGIRPGSVSLWEPDCKMQCNSTWPPMCPHTKRWSVGFGRLYLSGALQPTSAFEKADSAAPGLVPENGMCKWRSQSWAVRKTRQPALRPGSPDSGSWFLHEKLMEDKAPNCFRQKVSLFYSDQQRRPR